MLLLIDSICCWCEPTLATIILLLLLLLADSCFCYQLLLLLSDYDKLLPLTDFFKYCYVTFAPLTHIQ